MFNPIAAISKLRAAGASVLFTERDIIFSANNKTRIFQIADVVLPLQPLVEIRMSRNWVLTEVAGSACNPELSGAQIKENMGRSDAIITFSGLLMSSGKTMMQTLSLAAGAESEDSHWADKISNVVSLFNSDAALPILDWAPREESPESLINQAQILSLLREGVDPYDPRIRDRGVSIFEELGIRQAVLLSWDISEREGRDYKGYTLRLQEDRPVSLQTLMPIEEIESSGETYA